MKIYSVNDPEFIPYGRVVTGLADAKAEILTALAETPMSTATDYVAEDENLQELPAAVEVSEHLFGGMPCQLGWCNDHTQLEMQRLAAMLPEYEVVMQMEGAGFLTRQ